MKKLAVVALLLVAAPAAAHERSLGLGVDMELGGIFGGPDYEDGRTGLLSFPVSLRVPLGPAFTLSAGLTVPFPIPGVISISTPVRLEWHAASPWRGPLVFAGGRFLWGVAHSCGPDEPRCAGAGVEGLADGFIVGGAGEAGVGWRFRLGASTALDLRVSYVGGLFHGYGRLGYTANSGWYQGGTFDIGLVF